MCHRRTCAQVQARFGTLNPYDRGVIPTVVNIEDVNYHDEANRASREGRVERGQKPHSQPRFETKGSLRNLVNASASSLTSMGFTRWTAKPEAALRWRSCGWP